MPRPGHLGGGQLPDQGPGGRARSPSEPRETHVAVAGAAQAGGHTVRARLGSQGCGGGWGGWGGGLGGYHRRMAAPHLVLSGAVSHRLSGDLDSPPPAAPRLTRGRAQQSGQQHQAEALHGCRQHAPGGPREGAGAAGGGRLGHRPGREKPRSGRRPSPLPSSKVPPLFWHPKATSIPESRAWGRRGAPKPRPQPIRESIHHRCTPSREKRPALSLGDGPKCPLLALRTCGMRGGEVGVVGRRVLSLGSRRCVRRGKGRLRCEWTVPAGGGRGARYPHPHLWARGPGTGAEPPPLSPHASLGSHRGSRRGARASGRGHTHIPGVPRLRGSGRRGRRGEQCPSVSLRTGTRVQPCLSGNAAADTDPARGAGRSRGGGRAGGGGGWSRADGGAWNSGPRRVTVPGCLGPPGQQHPAPPPSRAPSPLPISSPVRSPYLRLPPPGRGQVPSPSAWLRSPWNFSEERLLRKETKGTKTQRGREGASAAGTSPGPCSRPLGPPLPTPSRSRWFKVILRAPTPTTTPRAAAAPGTAASNHTHTQRASPKPWSWHSRPSATCSGPLLSFVSCLLLPSRLSCCVLHLLSLVPESGLCWSLLGTAVRWARSKC